MKNRYMKMKKIRFPRELKILFCPEDIYYAVTTACQFELHQSSRSNFIYENSKQELET